MDAQPLGGKRWDEPDFVYPYEPDDPKREDPDAGDDVVRVVRGGSWLDHRIFAGCAARSWHRPNVAHSFIGFRVVLRSAPVASPEL
jgi:formylglycine-generating enzyme required for sulfatase activity